MIDELAHQVAQYRWYHTIELTDGVVTEGMFDHRPAVNRYMLPADLSGMRCLDVGTMDGFWAFEMERRGASEVVATDVARVDDLDWPPLWRPRVEAMQRMLHVCRGSTIVCNPVKRFVFGRGRPLVEFDGIDEFQWWLVSEPALERMMRAAGFHRVELGKAFELPAVGGGEWRGLRGVVRGFVEHNMIVPG
jgi:hypothetical protein